MAKPKTPAAHTRSKQEVANELREQLRALESLAEQFGRGERWAGKLMATVIYVICHDGRDKKTRSLLTQLDIRHELKCINTAQNPMPGNMLTSALMLGFRMSPEGSGQIPRFLMPPRGEFKWVPFVEWWEQAVYSQGDQNIITRRELVLAVRSKDGGGHFDSELECANYVNMKAGAGWQNMRGDEVMPPDPSHLLSVWAIGWELFTSLVSHGQQQQSPIKDA